MMLDREARNRVVRTLAPGVLFGFGMAAMRLVSGAPPLTAVVVGLATGVMFGAIMHLFVRRQEKGKATVEQASFDVDEPVIVSGLANHFKGAEAVGGHLFLTAKRLRFVSHRFNVQTHDESWLISDVVDAEPKATFGIVPNGFVVVLRDGRREQFVINDRNAWIERLRAMRVPHPEGATAALLAHVPDAGDVVPRLDDASVKRP